jgi:hypothetical protein
MQVTAADVDEPATTETVGLRQGGA